MKLLIKDLLKIPQGVHLVRLILTCLIYISLTYVGYSQSADWDKLDEIFGKKGNIKNETYKITFPRYDLNVKIKGFVISPELALTSWIGFIDMGNGTMMMGDLVLLNSEVEPVISKLINENLEVTAMHNHLINEVPNIKYLHFYGLGDKQKLASSIKVVLEQTNTPLSPHQNKKQMQNPELAKLDKILGSKGNANGNIVQYSFPRNEKISDHGMEMPAYLGMATGIAFQSLGNKAAVTGDFVLLADEVNPVAKALTQNGINVTAIHNHMLYDNPRLFMMHFWAVDDPEKLAKGLKTALDKTNSKR